MQVPPYDRLALKLSSPLQVEVWPRERASCKDDACKVQDRNPAAAALAAIRSGELMASIRSALVN